MGEFNDKVYETVRRVPRGKVVSYGQVARLRRGFLVTAWCSRTVRLRRVLHLAGLTNNGQGLPRRA